MRFSLALLLITTCISATAQNVLVKSEFTTTYFTAYQLPDSSDQTDKYRVTLDMKNYTTGDLFYSRADDDKDLNTIPHYLKIEAPNAISFKADALDVAATLMIRSAEQQHSANEPLMNAIYFYGTSTLIMDANGANIFRVKPIRIDKTFTLVVKEGDRPELQGEYTRNLRPKEKMELKKKRK